MSLLSLRTFFLSAFTALLTLHGPATVAAENCPLFKQDFTASYYGSYKGWRLDATQQLKLLSNKHWQFTLSAENPLGNINQISTFSLIPGNGLHSEGYRHQRNVLFKNQVTETAFNWKTHQANSTRGSDSTRTVSLQGGELDELNYQLALRCDLQAGKTEFHYNVVDWSEVNQLEFKVVGEEKLNTELGLLDTVVVKRIRNNNNRITTLWFAKSLNYQMVKLLQEERKDTEAYLLYIKRLDTRP